MRLSRITQVGPKSNDKYFYKRQKRRRQRPRAEDHVKRGAEMGVTWPQAKEHLEPLEAGRGRKEAPLVPSEGMWPRCHLDFRLRPPKLKENAELLF